MNATAPVHTVGLIGLDMWQAMSFAEWLNDPSHPAHVPGARVTMACAAPSDDWELSRTRAPQNAQILRDRWDMSIVDSPREVAESVDWIFINGADGRRHREWFEQIAQLAKPTFIQKPLACSTEDARAIAALAESHGALVMSCSAVRYAHTIAAAITANAGESIVACDAFGPLHFEPVLPGLFWYGIHGIEMLAAAMGIGCESVRAESNHRFTLHWPDGRSATFRGINSSQSTFGLTIHRDSGATYADTLQLREPMAASLLRTIVKSFSTGTSAIPLAETLQIVRIVEATNRSIGSGRDEQVPTD